MERIQAIDQDLFMVMIYGIFFGLLTLIGITSIIVAAVRTARKAQRRRQPDGTILLIRHLSDQMMEDGPRTDELPSWAQPAGTDTLAVADPCKGEDGDASEGWRERLAQWKELPGN